VVQAKFETNMEPVIVGDSLALAPSSQSWCGLNWSEWTPLTDRQLGPIPRQPGIYRVRTLGSEDLVYIGQTGRNLAGRLQQLRAGLFWNEMPFDDPHTATPNLWCLRVEEGAEFEASAVMYEGAKPQRMALECFLLWQYRIRQGRSTRCNFGHFHSSYSKSKNRKSGEKGSRLLEPQDPSESAPPLIQYGNSLDLDWMGLSWSDWTALNRESLVTALPNAGLYRIRHRDHGLSYIGETINVRERLVTHSRRFEMCEFSFMTQEELGSIHRKEWESDLIAAAFAEHGSAPKFQFGY
jgi:hypothetical protein